MSGKVDNLHVDDVELDTNNPRFGVVKPKNSKEAIQLLLQGKQKGKMLKLAEDIAKKGELNPTELLIVFDDDGKLITLEGNRRLACLKILNDPQLVENEKTRKGFEKILKDNESFCLKTMNAYRASSREEADKWIVLRHNGENGGVGVSPWSPYQKAIYSKEANLVICLRAYLEKEYKGKKEFLGNVDVAYEEDYTTLERLFESKAMREHLGLSTKDDGSITFESSASVFETFEKIFKDFAEKGMTVDEIKTAKKIREYIDTLPPMADSGAVSVTATAAQPSVEPTEDAVNNEKPKVSRNRKRKTRIFQDLHLQSVSPKINEVVKAMQSIDADKMPTVLMILMRVVIELVVTEGISEGVIKATDGKGLTGDSPLRRKVEEAIKTLDSGCNKNDSTYNAAWRLVTASALGIVSTLHACVHSTAVEALTSDTPKVARAFEPVLEDIDKLIGEKK